MFVHQSAEPGDRPARRGWIELRGALQRSHGVVQPALLEIDPGQVERAVRAAELFDLRKSLRGLNQFALLAAFVAFEQQADAIIIPALPLRDFGFRISDFGFHVAFDWECDAVEGDG